jgi:hypothetical protein
MLLVSQTKANQSSPMMCAKQIDLTRGDLLGRTSGWAGKISSLLDKGVFPNLDLELSDSDNERGVETMHWRERCLDTLVPSEADLPKWRLVFSDYASYFTDLASACLV